MSDTDGHTPGPWTVQNTADGVEVLGPGNMLVHMEDHGAIPSELPQPQQDRLWAETQANARLIAAAPTMAAELDRLRAVNAQMRGFLIKALDHCPTTLVHEIIDNVPEIDAALQAAEATDNG